MPSLSSYDGDVKKAKAGRTILSDIRAGNDALAMMHEAMGGYAPSEMYLLEGNHDGFSNGGRVARYLDSTPIMEHMLTGELFHHERYGWVKVPFLDIIEIDGILYCHLFPVTNAGPARSAAGQRNGASNAAIQVRGMMQSCTAGHKQGLDTHMHPTPTRTMRGIIAGSCYLHDEDYCGPLGNRHYRGILVKHDVSVHNPNHYDLMEVSLDYLKRRYGR